MGVQYVTLDFSLSPVSKKCSFIGSKNEKVSLRGITLYCFLQIKSATEANRMLLETYGDNAVSGMTCRDWFQRFKNNDFELEDKKLSDTPTKFKEEEVEELLDQNFYQTLRELPDILQAYP